MSTFVGTAIFVTNDQGVGEQAFICGVPKVITSNGQEVTTTQYDGLSGGTDENGQTVTSYDAPEPMPGAAATGDGRVWCDRYSWGYCDWVCSSCSGPAWRDGYYCE